MQSSTLDALTRKVLLLVLDDWTGLWTLAREARELGVEDDAEVMEFALSALSVLLERDLVIIGDLRSTDQFTPWATDVSESVGRVRRRWIELGRDPDIGEIAWLDMTSAQRQRVLDYLRQRG